MARVLIVFTDAASTEEPALVCDAAGHFVDFAATQDAPGVLSSRPFDLVLVACNDPLAPVAALRHVQPELPLVVVCDPLEAPAQQALRQAKVNGIVFMPFAAQTLHKVLGDELRSQSPEPAL